MLKLFLPQMNDTKTSLGTVRLHLKNKGEAPFYQVDEERKKRILKRILTGK